MQQAEEIKQAVLLERFKALECLITSHLKSLLLAFPDLQVVSLFACTECSIVELWSDSPGQMFYANESGNVEEICDDEKPCIWDDYEADSFNLSARISKNNLIDFFEANYDQVDIFRKMCEFWCGKEIEELDLEYPEYPYDPYYFYFYFSRDEFGDRMKMYVPDAGDGLLPRRRRDYVNQNGGHVHCDEDSWSDFVRGSFDIENRREQILQE
ncbi:MAG: hypothetical protein UT24_C0011G0044 [Candidatus Woesebacteria bacterium GW2011_GWB1_39_12]|uniref:Uncharacterized protein n=1 Tax=Candidatus Woesebacteria bacterium GW2011_GWB1_39_12 TaxID=1618574 RepID=A0A0G0MJR2_9BACT|nr:MAG: hypothetical protein UT24_C0011G0044 [Candidatus Woesebacteria bacterium GW2011_GWB1_39_12]